ncbi:MAG TPA: DUF362 domain-containing protein [Firmicutes bacterium]|nr:DUF362 domain-containing protein [Bacillota bacterium]
MVRPLISITRTPPRPGREAIAAAVRRAVTLAGGLPEAVRPGAVVLLKPNLVEIPYTRESGAVTHPGVCLAVAEMVRERGALPIIADAAGMGSDTEAVITFMGYDQLRSDGYTVLDLKKERSVWVENPAAAVLPRLRVYEWALTADLLINLPVMKTHDQTEVTLSLKNLKGLLDDCSKKAMHRRALFRGIPEIAAFFRPSLTILDAIYTQEGVGPVYGDPVEMDLILAGRDMVALDTVAGAIMGYRPEEVPTTMLAAGMGLGTADLEKIEIAGLPWQSVRRRFRRCSESEILKEVPSCSLQIGDDTCSGCRNTVISVLVELKARGRLDALSDKIIVTGTPPGHELPGEAILVGNCARQHGPNKNFIAGCPPENSWIIEALCPPLP